MLSHTPSESLNAKFADLKKSKNKPQLNKLNTDLKNASNFAALPADIRQAMSTKESFLAFLRDHHTIAENIKIEILVAKAIELDAIDAAVLLISKKHYLRKLAANSDAAKRAVDGPIPEFHKLMTKFEFSLQWLMALKEQFSQDKLSNYLSGHNAEARIIHAIKFIKGKDKIPSFHFNHIFDAKNERDDVNPYRQANLDYFIANPKTCANRLIAKQVKDMFDVASSKQVVSLCWELAKHRLALLKDYFVNTARGNPKVQQALTSENSERTTEFLSYKPRALTQELFKSDATTVDLPAFKLYLLRSHNPRKILKAHGDLVLKNSAREAAEIKSKDLQQIRTLLEENDITQLSTNFHFLVKQQKKRLKQLFSVVPALRNTFITTLTSDIDPHTGKANRNEWVIMHLKENPGLVKDLCAGTVNSKNFIKLLKLTDNPGEFVRKLAGQITSENRAKIIFQSVIEVARYTAEHPEYQAEFDKMLDEKFWCYSDYDSGKFWRNGGYRSVREIAIHFLSNELYQFRNQVPVEERKSKRNPQLAQWLGGTSIKGNKVGEANFEEDLRFLLQDNNTKKLFNLNTQQLQQIATQHVTQPSSHKVLAEHHYETLQLSTESAASATSINDKSVYYALRNVPAEKRSKALNQAIFGVAEQEQSKATKQLISLVAPNFFNTPLILLNDLDQADFDAFIEYFNQQIAKAKAGELEEISKRFHGIVRRIDFDVIINQVQIIQIQPVILEKPKPENSEPAKAPHPGVRLKSVAQHSIEASGVIFYEYANNQEHPEYKEFVNHLFLGLTTEVEMNRKVFYGAIVKGDWKFIEENKVRFIEALQVTDTSKTHFSIFDNVLTKDRITELVDSFTLEDLHMLRHYHEIKVAMVDKFTTDQPMDPGAKNIFLEMLADREFQAQADAKIAQVLIANLNDPVFVTEIIHRLDPAVKHSAIDKLFTKENAGILLKILIAPKDVIDHLSVIQMLDWCEKMNLKQGAIAVKDYLIAKANLNQIISAAQVDVRLQKDILRNVKCFTKEPLDAEAFDRFLKWYDRKEVQFALTPVLNDIIFLNVANKEFIRKLLDMPSDSRRAMLSDSKRTALLRDERLDEHFITTYPEALHFRKVAAAKAFKDIVKNNRTLLKKLSAVLNLPVVPQATIDFFKLDNYELFFQIINKKLVKEIFNDMDLKNFYQVITSFLADNEFVQALTQPENRATAIAILNSGDEKLIETFWNKAKDQTLLVEQVLDSIIDDQAQIEKAKDAIIEYFHRNFSREMANKYKDHQYIAPLLGSIMTRSTLDVSLIHTPPVVEQSSKTGKEIDDSKNQTQSVQPTKKSEKEVVDSEVIPVTTGSPQERKEPAEAKKVKIKIHFRHVEDVYKFINDYRNEKRDPEFFKKIFVKLRDRQPKLFDQVFTPAGTLDFFIALLLRSIEESLPQEAENKQPTELPRSPVLSKMRKKHSHKTQEQPKPKILAETQEKHYEISQERRTRKTKAKKSITAFFRKHEGKIQVKSKEIADLFKKLEENVKKNSKENFDAKLKKNRTTVWTQFESIKAQYALLEDLRNNNLIDIQDGNVDTKQKSSHLQAIAQEYGLTTTAKLNSALKIVLEQANSYLKEQPLLAAYYYRDIIEACSQDDIDPAIRYQASVALINLLIDNPGLITSSDELVEKVFNNLFDNSIYTAEFIKQRLKDFPLQWLHSSVIVNAIADNLESDDPNPELAAHIESMVASKNPEDAYANENLDALKKLLEIKVFVLQKEQHNNVIAQAQLLKKIFDRDPNLLFDERFTFGFDVILATAKDTDNLGILLFYLRNQKLSQAWLDDEACMKQLYSLARQDQLVKFVLETCYTHWSERINRDALTQAPPAKETTTELEENSMEGPVSNIPLPPTPPTWSTQETTNTSDAPTPPPAPEFKLTPPKPPTTSGKPTTQTKTETAPGLSLTDALMKNRNNIVKEGKTIEDSLAEQEKLKQQKKDEAPSTGKTTSGGGLGSMGDAILQKANLALASAWKALFFSNNQISPVGKAILAYLKVTEETEISDNIRRGFSEVFNSIGKLKDVLTAEAVLTHLTSNPNLKGVINKDAVELAKLISDLANEKKSKVVQKAPVVQSNKKVIVAKKLAPITAEYQIKEALKEKNCFNNLATFLGNVDQLIQITEPMLKLYEQFIRIKGKQEQTSMEEFKKALTELLKSHMTKDAIGFIEQSHTEADGPSLEEVLKTRTGIVFDKFDALYVLYARSHGKTDPSSFLQDIAKRQGLFQEQTQQTAEKKSDIIWSLCLYEIQIDGKPVFTQENIKKTLGNFTPQKLAEFENAIGTAIEKLQRGNRITKDVLFNRLYDISKNRSNFSANFDQHIWEPLKAYAISQGKGANVVELGQSTFVTAPTIESLYKDGIFKKEALISIFKEEILKQVEPVLVDIINYLQMNKPVFRVELLEKVRPLLSPADGEKDFDQVIWQAVTTYAKNKNKSHLVQEKFESKSQKNGPKLFDKSKQAVEATPTVSQQDKKGPTGTSTQVI